MPESLFQLRIALLDVEPEIWRTIVVSPEIMLGRLHSFIQAAFGWQDYHLYEFTARDERRFGLPDPDVAGFGFEEGRTANATRTPMTTVLQAPGDDMLYNYDFGDDWFCVVKLEALQPVEQTKWPLCLDGARDAPPEDCGGPYGYSDLLEQLKGRSARARKEAREVLGESFDPDRFDIEGINRRLQRYAPRPRPSKRH